MVLWYFHRSHLIHADNALERRKVLPKDVTEADFNKYILAANEAISPFDLEIRSTEHQISRKRTYALVNSTDDPILQADPKWFGHSRRQWPKPYHAAGRENAKKPSS